MEEGKLLASRKPTEVPQPPCISLQLANHLPSRPITAAKKYFNSAKPFCSLLYSKPIHSQVYLLLVTSISCFKSFEYMETAKRILDSVVDYLGRGAKGISAHPFILIFGVGGGEMAPVW